MSANAISHAKLLRQLATNIPEALWIADIESRAIRYVNPAWQKITGRRVIAGDAIDKVFEAIHPEDLSRFLEHASRLADSGVDLDCRLMRPDGTVRWARARTIPIANSEGSTYRIVGILDDITARKEESYRVERLKDEFVATVSHELRTPLTSIAGALSLLVGNAAGTLPDSAVRLITIAHGNSQRLVRLVNSILDIEKIESGKVVFVLKRIDVRSLVEQSIEANRAFAEGYGVRLRLETKAAAGEIRGDPDWLVQVVTNLLSNAIKFSPPGAEVVIGIERRSSTVVVSVRDHGPGIPEDFKPRIFEKFAQADVSDTRQKGGTGLGLSIVKQIVMRLGGEVGFADAPGGGTIFHLELPRWRRGERAEEKASPNMVLNHDYT
jgi:PAS domain S-box-containing protein